MPPTSHRGAAVGMWLVAVVSAIAVMIAPLTPWILPVAVTAGAVCIVSAVSLVLWLDQD